MPSGRNVVSNDMDMDGDGVENIDDDYPHNPVRSAHCQSGYYGRYHCIAASQGHYVPSSGLMYATHADAGHYVDDIASSSQDACDVGTYQPDTGQSSCHSADAGHYVDSNASTNQTACPTGTYQPDTGQSSCDSADAGHYVDSTASTNQTACPTGTYQPS